MALSEDEVRHVVRAVLDEEKTTRTSIAEADVLRIAEAVAVKTIGKLLASIGVKEEDAADLRKDLEHLRKWRTSVEQAQSITFKTVITVIATSVIGAVWLGIKTALAVKGG
ncbi:MULTISPECIES: hypothetical protein [unclassified Bradyrhizobium]|uniref:hypothetical protein n=1 Tax=unclassified Bradyrhizobium TaxID=2631580 RepID=UPI0029163EB9|nr:MULTISPECIES: hypothetical protein [unclassified Bradyrhizobium]